MKRLIAPLLLIAAWSAPALAAGPEFDAYAQEGRRYLAEGEPDRAALSFEEALRINPFDAVALNNLASARVEAGDYNRALDLLKRAARLAPEDRDIAANLSRLRGWLNSYSDAGMQAPHPDELSGFVANGRLPPPPPPLWEPARRR